MKELVLGQVVRSKAGRDKDIFMIIIAFDKSNADYVLISDGIIRKYESPKRKKIIHLAKTNYIVNDLREKLNNGEEIQNNEIIKALESFNHKEPVTT